MTTAAEVNGNMSVANKSLEKTPQNGKQNTFWNINKEMLPYKMHFFLFLGGMGAILPYIPVFAKNRLGLSATATGVVFTVSQFVIIFTKPAIGFLADYFNKLKAIIIILTVIFVSFMFILLAIPKLGPTDVAEAFSSHWMLQIDGCRTYADIESKFTLSDVMHCQKRLCYNDSQYGMNYSSNYLSSLHNIAPDQNESHYTIFVMTCTSYNNEKPLHNLTVTYENLINEFQLNVTDKINVILCSEQNDFSNSKNEISKISCYNGSSIIKENEILQSFYDAGKITISCALTQNTSEDAISSSTSSEVFRMYQFWVFAFALWFGMICCNALFTLSDTACYESLQKTGSDYGRQRMWGAVSWGIIAPFAGFLNDYTGDFLASWCLMGFFCVLQIWNLARMDLVKPHFSENILKDVRTMFRSKEFVAFELGVLMTGMVAGILWFYLIWFLSNIGSSRLLVGLAHTMQCFAGELPFFFYAGRITKKLGHFNAVSLGLFASFIRFFTYSYIYVPWMVLPVESVHGLTYGVFYSAMTSYGKLSAKPGTEATTQSVLCLTYEGIGAGLGAVIAGVGFDHLGGHRTFFYTSMFCAVATAINIVLSILVKKRKVLEITNSLNPIYAVS